MRDGEALGTQREPADLNALLISMRGRHSSNLIDKVCAIAFPFQKHGSFNIHNVTLPIYDPNTPPSVAWERLISSIASAKMEYDDLWYLGNPTLYDHDVWYSENPQFHRTTTIQLLCLFPHLSTHHWFPSWAQVQQYPDVSVRDNDPVPVAEDRDYSLRIVSGRIYRGCSLELKRPPTPKRKAIYHCSMDCKLVKLVAPVPGIELNIDSRSKYVLVDINPDHSLWPYERLEDCCRGRKGHVHPPIWRDSVIIVCKEVDNLAHAQCVQFITGSPGIQRYRLRRITTLKWGWEDGQEGPNLPVRPSLEHMRSVVCSAEGSMEGLDSVTSLDVFCDPAAVEGLPIKNGKREWDKCPLYEVYLV